MTNHKFQYLAAGVLFCMLFSFQLIRTQLRVTVKDETGNYKPGTEVSLYNSSTDFNDNKKAFGPIISDKKGRAVFSNTKQGPYILEARNGEYSNDFGNQITDTLELGKINKIEVIISK